MVKLKGVQQTCAHRMIDAGRYRRELEASLHRLSSKMKGDVIKQIHLRTVECVDFMLKLLGQNLLIQAAKLQTFFSLLWNVYGARLISSRTAYSVCPGWNNLPRPSNATSWEDYTLYWNYSVIPYKMRVHILFLELRINVQVCSLLKEHWNVCLSIPNDIIV